MPRKGGFRMFMRQTKFGLDTRPEVGLLNTDNDNLNQSSMISSEAAIFIKELNRGRFKPEYLLDAFNWTRFSEVTGIGSRELWRSVRFNEVPPEVVVSLITRMVEALRKPHENLYARTYDVALEVKEAVAGFDEINAKSVIRAALRDHDFFVDTSVEDVDFMEDV